MSSTYKPSPPTFPVPAKPPVSRRHRITRAARRALYAGTGLFLILLIVFFLLPIWISNEQGRAYVLQQINSRMRASVAIDNWSLSWFHGTDITNLSITLPDGSRLLSCPHVHSELTLWGILWGNYDVGTTPIDALQLNLTKYPDGTTSLDALNTTPKIASDSKHTPGLLASVLRNLRGSIQVNSAIVTITSIRAGQSLTYTDVKGAVTIASPDAPFHMQLSAIAPDRTLLLNATLPSIRQWPTKWSDPRLVSTDMEFSATNLPAALLCDYFSCDLRWANSIGPMLESASFTNHAVPAAQASRPTLILHGSQGATVNARLLFSTDRSGNTSLAIPPLTPDDDFHLTAVLHLSQPLAHQLQRVVPIFDQARSADGLFLIDLATFTASPTDLTGQARITFPPIVFAREQLLARLLHFSSVTDSKEALIATASPLRVNLGNDTFSYENFAITLNDRQKIIFSGSATTDGRLHLLARVAASAGPLLSASTVDIPISGTANAPIAEVSQ